MDSTPASPVRARSTFKSGDGSANDAAEPFQNVGDLMPLPMLPNTFSDENAPLRTGTTKPPTDSFGLKNVS